MSKPTRNPIKPLVILKLSVWLVLNLRMTFVFVYASTELQRYILPKDS